MNKAIKQYLFFIFFLFLPATIWGQDTFEVTLSITDTEITVKKSTNRNRYAAKVNVEINVPNLQDTLVFYYFNKYIPAGYFEDMDNFDYYKNSVIGLKYIVEDKNHSIIPVRMVLGGEFKGREKRPFVNSRLKIKLKKLNKENVRIYDLAKYEIANEKQNIVLYPLLSRITTYTIPKGEYYIYFVYAFVPPTTTAQIRQSPLSTQFVREIANDSSIFRGSFVSNKVKLIVK